MFETQKTLKTDAFGKIEKGIFTLEDGSQVQAIRREYTTTFPFNLFALFLAKNEKRAINKLQEDGSCNYFPRLLHTSHSCHIRSYIEGCPMHKVDQPLSYEYFIECKKLLKFMRKRGITNNDLAKEANWLVTPEGEPAISDFQLAICFKTKNKLFLSLCYEDLRHLLKHKNKYLTLTHQEKNLLKNKSIITKFWTATGKKLYWFITRRFLGWKDRQGPEERNF